jgi:hypothetical protein
MNSITKGVILVVIGLFGLVFDPWFLLFFAPVVVYFLWNDHDRIKELERRLNEAGKAPDESAQST